MALPSVDKFRKAREAEFCIKCFDKGIKFVGGSHLSKETNQAVQCMVTKDSKHRYSCLDKECLNHMWVCRKHKKLNEPVMKKQQARLKASGGSLNFHVDPSSAPAASAVSSPATTPNLPVQPILLEYIPTALPDSIRNTMNHSEISDALQNMQANQSFLTVPASSQPNQKEIKECKEGGTCSKVQLHTCAKGFSNFHVSRG